MANLRAGVLFRLLQEMGVEEKEFDDCRQPVLLQIRSIIPVLSEGDHDLWPNQGFFLKVSDFSHEMYVSLPQEQDDMILCNKLQLGQLIYVQKLEAAYPVPMLKGINPVPGRHPCDGEPADLVSLNSLERFYGVFEKKMIVEESNVDKKPRESFHSSRPPRSCTNVYSNSSDVDRVHSRRKKSRTVDNKSDSEPSTSTLSSVSSRRRSWSGVPDSTIGDVSDVIVVKHEIKPIRQAVPVSSTRPPKCYSSEENSSSRSRRKDSRFEMKPAKHSNQRRTSASRKNNKESLYPAMEFDSLEDKKGAEAEILWDSLPLNLVKLGKDMLRQRDGALLAAVESLQDASAAERLLKCLSVYSELQSNKGDDQQPSLDKVFNLQNDLAKTRLIVQSLKDDSDPSDPASIKQMLKVGLDRRTNATSWIKAALESDLAPTKPKKGSLHTISAERRPSTTIHGGKKKGTSVLSQRSNREFHIELAADNDNRPDWFRGTALYTAADLANSLQSECRTWFLAYVEHYLDEVADKSVFRESDNQVAAIMFHIKKMNDWLDVIVKREGDKNISTLQDSELEAYGRVKDKIYQILLKNVERTAMAFEHISSAITED